MQDVYQIVRSTLKARSRTTDSVWVSADRRLRRRRGIAEELLCGLATMQEFEDSVPSLLQLLESKYSIVCIFFVYLFDSHSIAPEANVSLCLVCVN